MMVLAGKPVEPLPLLFGDVMSRGFGRPSKRALEWDRYEYAIYRWRQANRRD